MDNTMLEVLAFWTGLMKDPEQKIADRLKASENLARYSAQEEGPEEDRELRIFVDYGGGPCR